MKTLCATLLSAVLLGPGAGAAEIDNPACHLLTEDEARGVLGGDARESETNREMTGASDCGWIAETGNAIAINLARGLAFQGTSTAEDGYRALRNDYARGGLREDMDGLGEAAFLFTPRGARPGTRYIAVFLHQGSVVTMATYGASRGATVELMELAAGRIEPPRQ